MKNNCVSFPPSPKNWVRRVLWFPTGSLHLGTLTFLGWIILVVGAVLCVVGCSAASLASICYMPVALFPGVTTSNIGRRCQMSFEGQSHLWLRSTILQFLQISLMSNFKKDAWIFVSASAINLL